MLAASHRRRVESQEAGIKYFVLGGFSSAFFLYGIALVYGATGSTNLSEIVDVVPATGARRAVTTRWCSPASRCCSSASASRSPPSRSTSGPPTSTRARRRRSRRSWRRSARSAAFAALLRVLVVALPLYRDDWRPAVWVLAVLSLVVGSVLAVVQTNVKRMLAYSSISHAGFILVGVEAAAPPGRASRQPATACRRR